MSNDPIGCTVYFCGGFPQIFGSVFWWLGLVVPLLAGGAATLALAVAREAREARDPGWRRPRCLDCGAAVPHGAAVCPRCRSVEIGVQGRAHAARELLGWAAAALAVGGLCGALAVAATFDSWPAAGLVLAAALAASGTSAALRRRRVSGTRPVAGGPDRAPPRPSYWSQYWN